MTTPSPWRDYDRQNFRTMYNSESFLSWEKGYWPRGSYSGHMRLEPGRWPPAGAVNPPYSNSWFPESGSLECSRESPCPWGGKDNEGVLVMQNGKPTRRGMCYRLGTGGAKCDCPIGQESSEFCAGQAHRDAFGEVAWSWSELGIPTYDPYTASQDFW